MLGGVCVDNRRMATGHLQIRAQENWSVTWVSKPDWWVTEMAEWVTAPEGWIGEGLTKDGRGSNGERAAAGGGRGR